MTSGSVPETHVARRTDEYIAKVLAQAPPLTNEQRTRLAERLRPVRQNPLGGGSSERLQNSPEVIKTVQRGEVA
jgi:hypothetical protein